MDKNDKKPVIPGGVNEYIKACPAATRDKLEHVRAAIRAVAPGSIETVSYFQIPGYSYPGFDYNGMFAWFSFKQPYIRLHVRPPVLQEHADQLVGYRKTASIISFPLEEEIPEALIKKLVKASLAVMKNGAEQG